MRVVYKFGLRAIDEVQLLDLGDTAQVVHVGEQVGEICLWVEKELDPLNDPFEPWRFLVVGTGQQLDNGGKAYHEYVGTVQMSNGLVWHVYQEYIFAEGNKTPIREIESE